MTADLVSSLSSALDKREELAKAAIDAFGQDWRDQDGWDAEREWISYDVVSDAGTVARGGSEEIAQHILANSPEWVLRDCEAKRRVLARHEKTPNGYWCNQCSAFDDGVHDAFAWPCVEIRDLAYALGVDL